MSRHLVLGVITARGGSKGIPGKNIKPLRGKSLIAWSIEAATRSELLTRTIVSTDDADIARIAKEAGADVPFMRPAELGKDATPHVPVMQHALAEAEKAYGERYDYIVTLQPTSPLRTGEDIDASIRKVLERGADSGVSIVKLGNYSPSKIKKLTDDDRLEPYSDEEGPIAQRHDLPPAYKRNGAVYVTRRDVLDNGSLIGDHCVGYVMPPERSIDIDSLFDWRVAEALMADPNTTA